VFSDGVVNAVELGAGDIGFKHFADAMYKLFAAVCIGRYLAPKKFFFFVELGGETVSIRVNVVCCHGIEGIEGIEWIEGIEGIDCHFVVLVRMLCVPILLMSVLLVMPNSWAAFEAAYLAPTVFTLTKKIGCHY